MGCALGPSFANFYMGHLENNLFAENTEFNHITYCRYVDNIFLIVNSTQKIGKLKSLSERNSVLSFTYEIEKNKNLAFLDTLVKREEQKLSTSVYAKSTNTGDCFNCHSI